MKFVFKYVLVLTALFFFTCTFSSCSTSELSEGSGGTDTEAISMAGHRGVDLDNQIVLLEADQNQDDESVSSLYRSLMSAEDESNQLNIKFQMVSEISTDGNFIFTIESTESKEYKLLIFDEEGFETVGQNTFNVHQGNNYKSLNARSLPDGDYIFKIEDESGRHLTRRITVDQNSTSTNEVR